MAIRLVCVLVDATGNFIGTTYGGGAGASGLVFELETQAVHP